ncbi:anthranilate synthase component II [Candidatus Magnetaquicoccus inordinatus]|uniref:anthranilate synthase component II n=1 Tax=Candidatus Magnetaquicoccus inordinatus TaxID=2496818 RepID=UPI00102BCBD4|nr:aminodeoxychorismate/anthranilate synthase component II [Candidatus Magnetaquicoccus inordinatus]
MLLLIDNYDSFTYNLAQYLGELGQELQVVRNDAITLEEIATLAPSHIVLSPGPGNPDQAGITLSVISHFAGRIPILGVCLGHQAIGQAFGGQVVRAPKQMHGKTSAIYHDRSGVFRGLNNPLTATRYHSLVVAEESIPDCLLINAWTDPACESGRLVMGLRHKELPVHGVQFHPESILTEQGHEMLANFLQSVSS